MKNQETTQQKELREMSKKYSKQYESVEIQQMLLDQAIMWIVESNNDKDSLTDKVVSFDVVWHNVGVTWLNKDGSYHSKVFKANEDPETKDYAPTVVGFFNNVHRI